ncbi:uncharacterized protein LOC100862950 [Apis florea]|uniref:uncharacterized protein LOC100862950 n=1 Tax=Apis florea TaxID=7463 RepID=UPI000252C097|nr:uncharacterized protein LOC100862950 [Apis florea]
MKTIVIIFAFCICVGAMTIEELKAQLRDVQQTCKAESGIDEQKANDVHEGSFDVEDEIAQLYSQCIINKFNTVDESGNFNENVVREIMKVYLDENNVNQLVSECSSVSDANIHLKFSKLMICFEKYKTIKEILNL